jgi:hypothetical protein
MPDVSIGAARPAVHSTATHKRKKIKIVARKPRVRKGTFGIPPPPKFDFDALPDGAWLTNNEVAAVLRRSKVTPAAWRTMPDHPLKWTRIDGKPLYRVRDVRSFITSHTVR